MRRPPRRIHPAEKGSCDPDLTKWLAEATRCGSLRPSRRRITSLSNIKKREIWTLEIEDAFLEAEPSQREVYVHASPGRGPSNPTGVWRLRGTVNGPHDAPAAPYNTPCVPVLLGVQAGTRAGRDCWFFI